jgi:hypothetical protein
VKGRPAITPDVTLLLRYFAAELNLGASGDWDPASESSYTLDWNPDNSASLTVIDDEIDAIADGAAVDVDSGLSISAASAPERMPLSVAQFAGGQDAAFADDAKVLGAADALVLGDMSDSTWFYVLWPHQATNGQSLLTVSGLFELWVDHTTGSDVELHDGTALRATGFTQPVGEGYVTSLYLDSGTGRARYGFNSQLAALLTYDGTLAFDTTPLTLGGAIGPGYIGRILAFNERMSDDEIKARSLALIGQYLLPKTAT